MSGNVGIGTKDPAKRLHVVGNVKADDYLYNSDIRLKTDITALADALEGIQGLQGVTYRWADPASSQEKQVGLIAQDVEDCYPEVVATDAKGFKSVAYSRLVAPLFEAVKAQQQVIDDQGKEIVRLKAATQTLHDEVAALRSAVRELARDVKETKRNGGAKR